MRRIGAVQGFASEHHRARAQLSGGQADPVAWPEHHDPAGLKGFAGHDNATFNDIDATIFVIVGQRQLRSRGQHDVSMQSADCVGFELI
jgi:hypothetical protein